MIAYIRERDGKCASSSVNSALQGFNFLGVPYRTYKSVEEIPTDPRCIPVGFANEIRSQLLRLGITAPYIDYPPELLPWMGRKMKKITLGYAQEYMNQKQEKRYFMKPVRDKVFDVSFLKGTQDLKSFSHLPKDTQVWIGPYVSFGTEYRCYIYKKEEKSYCIGSYRYKGDGNLFPDDCQIFKMIEDYSSAPAAYALDIAVDAGKVMRLVAVNDGYSVENYGMTPEDYAIWLIARWNQLVGEKAYQKLPSGLL